MAEVAPPPAGGWWDAAYEQLDSYLLTQGGRRLPAELLAQYADRHARAGWRLLRSSESGARRLDVLIGDTYPFAAPDLILVDRPPHLTWPHIESDGRLCLFPLGTTVDARRPVNVLQELLSDSDAWLAASEAGANLEDFRTEFLSYWDADPHALRILSLLSPAGPSRMITAHLGQSAVIVADDAGTLRSWRRHVAGRHAIGSDEAFEPGALLWLDAPMTPAEFPASAGEVFARLRAAGLGQDIDAVEAKALQRLTVVFGARSTKGTAFCGVTLRRAPSDPRSRPNLERGFRPGRAPPQVLAARVSGASRLSRSVVERVDPSWIHGRDGDADLTRLRAARVAFVGCGSLGGSIALALAQAGVGALDLIDPQGLAAANVGRHPLGVGDLGRPKATALAEHIAGAYPHIRDVRAHETGWEVVARETPDVLADADLVVSTAGDWGAEGALDVWRRGLASPVNLLCGWTEPNGVAGHVVACVAGAGCLACGLSAYGEPLLAVAAWPNGLATSFEPACGVSFQPYGPVEAAHVAALISEAALDVLTGRVHAPTHRVWVAREATLARAGGVLSPVWLMAEGGGGGRVVERPWPARPGCPGCGGVDP